MAAVARGFPVSSRELASEHLILVRRRNLRWEVALDGVTRRMIDWLCTRERALEHALEMAGALASSPASASVRVVVEGVGGAQQDVAFEPSRLRVVGR
jgi:hypothetical protein